MMRFLAWRALGLIATLAGWSVVLALMLPAEGGGFFGRFDPEIMTRMSVTLPLATMTLVLGCGLGLSAAYVAAGRSGSTLDLVLDWLARVLLSLSAVWIGMVLVVVVAGLMRLLPPGGFMPWGQDAGGALISLLMPATALALPLAAVIMRYARSAFDRLEVAPHVFGARLSGMSRAAATRRGAPIALAQLCTDAGWLVGATLAGAMVVENIFYLPGLGRQLATAIADGDGAGLRGVILVMIAIIAACQLLGAVAGAALDRRLADRVLP